MNVLLVSQCNKFALKNTRRILDQFAERKGDRTWQTAITEQGLKTLSKLLRKTARRNTAVACHWIKSANRTELLWIVGNIRRFNEAGTVPTNITRRNILRSQDENQWHTIEDISILAGIAGLFHDFGKANALFQRKLNPNKKSKFYEPYRHEWVSLRLFEAFVGNLTDEKWLNKLADLNAVDEKETLDNLFKDSPGRSNNPFATMPTLAKVIGWLIVSHHRLLKFPENKANEPKIEKINTWMTGNRFNAYWNSAQCDNCEWNDKDYKAVWDIKNGSTPLSSKTWRKKACSLANRALKRSKLRTTDWFKDNFSLHLSRLVLMLSDHYYSSIEPIEKWQDSTCTSYANTDKKTRCLKQKLDEHNRGVGHYAVLLAKTLPSVQYSLPSIRRHKSFKRPSRLPKFRWQNKAYELACSVRERSQEQGFFGVNLASTGCGKTFANARIMYGLADEKLGCRFSIALGLRVLTLQTADVLRNQLELDDEILGVLIGSQSIQQLHEYHKNMNDGVNAEKVIGSESSEDFFPEHQYVYYDGTLDDGRLSHWLKQNDKLHKLVSAPILVSTIDHLIPATEGERGGKQIAPMLRLLTSDLVLDEPDDFNLSDLPALCRLVNWAGMLGSRVLISSATLPPALVEALFDAYRAGRIVYQNAVGEPNSVSNICCAWFDEYGVDYSDNSNIESFKQYHQRFVAQRCEGLNHVDALRKAAIIPIKSISNGSSDAIIAVAEKICQSIYQLHGAHHQIHPDTGQCVSVGLVRMANINPMIAVAKELLSTESKPDYCIHYCIYHSQYPLAARSFIEKKLDDILMERDKKTIWQTDPIKKTLSKHPEKNQVFVVLATPVSEVGRDHDYDWAVVEPSSMRSLIQLAGRIQRHRQKLPNEFNMLVLSRNYKALKGKNIAYEKPGFESAAFTLASKDLNDILLPEQLTPLTAIPRIQQRHPSSKDNMVDLEHEHLKAQLFGKSELFEAKIPFSATLWWKEQATWCAELQRHTRFRQSAPDELFILYFEEEGEEPQFNQMDPDGNLKLVDKANFEREAINLAKGVFCWGDINGTDFFIDNILKLSEDFNLDVGDVCRKFGEIRLRKLSERANKWLYHPVLGVYGALV